MLFGGLLGFSILTLFDLSITRMIRGTSSARKSVQALLNLFHLLIFDVLLNELVDFIAILTAA